MRGLYAIVDLTILRSRELDPLTFASAVIAAGPVVVQVRAKKESRADVVGLLRALLPLCHDKGVLLAANDSLDVALAAPCDWLHVGQTDVRPAEIRQLAPSLGYGLSTHSIEQIAEALVERPRYVAFGPIFATNSKSDHEPVVGIAGLARAAAVVKSHPLAVPIVAIGGVTLERASLIREHADMAAVIGDLLPPRDLRGYDVYAFVTERARALHVALGA